MVYFAHAENVAYDVDVLAWWFSKRNVLPTWYYHVMPIAAIFQPTSCAAERVFAMLRWMFGDNQESLLEDYKETALMMRFNASARRAPQMVLSNFFNV